METMRLINGILRDKCYNGICVDRSYYAVEWNTAHGYDITRTVQDEAGNKYNIWEKPGFICATPA